MQDRLGPHEDGCVGHQLPTGGAGAGHLAHLCPEQGRELLAQPAHTGAQRLHAQPAAAHAHDGTRLAATRTAQDLFATRTAGPRHRSGYSGPTRRSAGKQATVPHPCGCRHTRAAPVLDGLWVIEHGTGQPDELLGEQAGAGVGTPPVHSPRRPASPARSWLHGQRERPQTPLVRPGSPAGSGTPGSTARPSRLARSRQHRPRCTSARSPRDRHRRARRVRRPPRDVEWGSRRRHDSRSPRAIPHAPPPTSPRRDSPRRTSRAESRSAQPVAGTRTRTLPASGTPEAVLTTESTRSIGSVAGGIRTIAAPPCAQTSSHSDDHPGDHPGGGTATAGIGDDVAGDGPGKRGVLPAANGRQWPRVTRSARRTIAGRPSATRPTPSGRRRWAEGPSRARTLSGRTSTPSGAAASSATTHPRTLRPCNGTRTRVPMPTSWDHESGHGVVERLRERGHLGAHAHRTVTGATPGVRGCRVDDRVVTHTRRQLPSGERGGAQSPSAARRSSTRGVASHVNSLSDRPKCP